MFLCFNFLCFNSQSVSRIKWAVWKTLMEIKAIYKLYRLYLIDCILLISLFSRYNVQWYLAPFHIQKLILFLLQRSSKTVSLNFGILFTLSLEFFATVKNHTCFMLYIYIYVYNRYSNLLYHTQI